MSPLSADQLLQVCGLFVPLIKRRKRIRFLLVVLPALRQDPYVRRVLALDWKGWQCRAEAPHDTPPPRDVKRRTSFVDAQKRAVMYGMTPGGILARHSGQNPEWRPRRGVPLSLGHHYKGSVIALHGTSSYLYTLDTLGSVCLWKHRLGRAPEAQRILPTTVTGRPIDITVCGELIVCLDTKTTRILDHYGDVIRTFPSPLVLDEKSAHLCEEDTGAVTMVDSLSVWQLGTENSKKA